MVNRQLEPQRALPRLPNHVLRRLEQIRLHERSPDRHALRLEEGVGHRAADEQRVHLRHEVLNHFQLVRHLGAAEDRDERTVRPLEYLPEILDFRGHEQPRGRLFDLVHDPFGRGMRAVRRSKGVVHVHIGEIGQLPGEAGIVLLFLRVEPEVLQEDDLVAAARPLDGGRGSLADRVLSELDRLPEKLREPRRNRPQRVLRIRFALRPSEVRREDHRRAALERVPDGRQRRPDARVVADGAVLDRDVEVHADEHALAPRGRGP